MWATASMSMMGHHTHELHQMAGWTEFVKLLGNGQVQCEMLNRDDDLFKDIFGGKLAEGNVYFEAIEEDRKRSEIAWSNSGERGGGCKAIGSELGRDEKSKKISAKYLELQIQKPHHQTLTMGIGYTTDLL
ncbi:hypothetical protein BSKO_11556 [Bryopsis sp. KO-2023]|nr:hypothetical protein BSKO_11556 [Bryopsis sp. KO-2023]